jgi:2-methylcitrate dehydratase PrpD
MSISVGSTRTASAQLADFCNSLHWAGLPDTVRARTQELVLDLLGVALGGSGAESSRVAAQLAAEARQPTGASVIGASFRTSAAWAALANGVAGHALEMDDVTRDSSLHPGVVVIPAALAVAEARDLSSTAFLEAVVCGYEVTMRVGAALNPASAYARGFHPTGVAGALGAAAAVAKLLGVDSGGLVRAMGIAGTLASGSMEYLSDGSWTKRLNAGWAAHAGVVAAGLGAHGYTGPATAIDGRLGLLHAYSDAPEPDRLLDGLGNGFAVMRAGVKPYPCCRYNHGLIDCALALRTKHRLAAEDVKRMRLGVLSGGWLLVAEDIEQKRNPQGTVDAQFSAPYAAAVALTRGSVRLADYAERALTDPAIRSLMSHTECYRDASLDAVYPETWPAVVEIETVDGQFFIERSNYALGEPENPVSREGLVAKFVDLTGERLGGDCALALADRILHLESEPDVKRVMDELRGDRVVPSPGVGER